jgi:hypothetical protein
MVAHFAIRTRSFRESAIGLASWMVDVVREDNRHAEALRTALQQKFTRKDVIRLIRDDLTNRGLKPVEIERRLPFLVSKMGPLIEQEMDKLVAEGTPVLDEVMRNATGELPSSIRTAFIEAMREALPGGPRAKGYSEYNWFVLHLDDPAKLRLC